MKRCRRVGVNSNYGCNCHCTACFYRWSNEYATIGNTEKDKTLAQVMAEITAAKARGCDSVVFEGFGEPTMWAHITECVKEIGKIGMTSSIITNGTMPIKKYAELREAGLNHLHVSVHHIHPDHILGHPGSEKKHNELFAWLLEEDWTWRANITTQKANKDVILETSEMCVAYGCRYVVALGFLPLYGWPVDSKRFHDVVEDPAVLSPKLAETADYFDKSTIHFTIRYHPMCLLPKNAWKYVTNARMVLYDEFEWEYSYCGLSDEDYWKAALGFGDGVAIQGEPCVSCDLLMHCGAYNRTMYAAFPNCGIHAIKDSTVQQTPGWLFDQNPARETRGYY